MRIAASTAIAMGVLCAAAWAQAPGTIALTYQDTKDTEHPLIAAARVNAANLPGAPAGATAPEGLSSGARWHRANLGGRQLMLITEPKGGVIYADADFDSNLAEESPLTGVTYRSEALMPSATLAQFGPYALKGQGEGQEVNVRVTTVGQQLVMVTPAGFVTAKASLPAGVRSVAIVDANYDGRYDGAMGAGDGADMLAVDANDDGRIETGGEAGEMMALPKMFKSGEMWLAAKVEPDGSAITLSEATPVFGGVRLQSSDAYVVAGSEYGVVKIGGTTETIEEPVGKYEVARAVVMATDSEGAVWRADSKALPEGLASFEVEEGRTTQLAFGAPLTLKVNAATGNLGERSFGMTIVGLAGEEYSPSITFNGNVTPAPGIRIVGEDGKVLAAGAFSYG